jgi:hypothetical protein
MRSSYSLLTFLSALLVFHNCATSQAKASHQENRVKPRGGIHQIVETRNGRTSCWGVVIQLRERTFKKSIDPDELTITDAKHSGDLKSIMIWKVDKDGKRLTIKFEAGTGDFGSGNAVMIGISGSAFKTNPEQGCGFEISTDLL